MEVSRHVCQTKLCGGAHDKEDIIEMLNAMLQRPVEDWGPTALYKLPISKDAMDYFIDYMDRPWGLPHNWCSS